MQLKPHPNHNRDFLENFNDSLNLNQVLVIIPVLNEAATISTVIQSLQQFGLTQIRVVDNGSTDDSVTLAKQAGAEVVIEPIAGYGRACWKGLQHLPPHIEWILFCDGDGSDDLSELPQFLTATTDADLILGNRRATSAGRAAMTPVQNFGNGLATLLINFGWGYRYQDLGPLRLIKRSALEAIKMQDRGFGWTVEMQARAIELGLKICEIPVNYRRRQGGRSKISGTLSGSVQAGTIILTTLGKLYLQRLWGKQKLEFSLKWLSSFLLLLGCIWIIPYGDFRQVEAVPQFLVGIAIMSVGFVLSWGIQNIRGIGFWAITILTRILLLPMYPGDDVWRYLWEGYIQTLGFSPYDLAPNAPELIPYHTPFWSLINNIETSAIYPPITQFGFRALAAIAPSVLLFKLAFFLADLGVCWLLSKKFGYSKTLLYAWNPLIIYSFAGGAHYDSWFILPLVAGWLICSQRQWSWSATLIGISIAIKWMSLPILGFLAWLQLPRFKSAIAIFILGGLPLLFTAIPFCSAESCPLIPTRSNFVLFARSASFSPHLLREIFNISLARNTLYFTPILVVFIVLLWQDYKNKNINFFSSLSQQSQRLLFLSESYLMGLLILSPIIHAWYFTWLIPFAVATRNLGTRLVSLSAFIYFILHYKVALGDFSWNFSLSERLFLWLPFIGGMLWTAIQSKSEKIISANNQKEVNFHD